MTTFSDSAVDLDATLDKHPITSDMKTKVLEKDVMQHIELLLMMDEDALLGRPGVCAGLNNYIAEAWDDHTRVILKSRISNTLSFEPRIEVVSINFSFDYLKSDLSIYIKFKFLDTDTVYEYNTTLRKIL